MKIVQSYHKKEINILNFYTFFLSYLTLKKHYGKVTMYCDRKSYDKLIKFIPYDEVIITECDNIDFKSKIIFNIAESFIHVDTNIFIFDSIFDNYINDKYDLLVKNVSNKITLGPAYFVDNNKEFLSKIFNITSYNNKYFETDILGMNLNFRDKYLENYNKISDAMKNNVIIGNYNFGYKELILEELTIYLTFLNNNFKCNQIIPMNDVLLLDENQWANKYKYTIMNLDYRFDVKNIKLIKNKIKKDFSYSYYFLEIFESNNNIT